MRRGLTNSSVSCEQLDIAYIGVQSRVHWIELGLGLEDGVDLIHGLGRELFDELDSL